MKALIFAAGLGTRLKPLTDTMPKALVPVGGKPLLRHVLDKLIAAGYDDIVINVHHFADQIREYVAANDSFGVKIAFSDETDLLRETGGGIRHAEPLLAPADAPDTHEPFLVHNVDILSNLDPNAKRSATSCSTTTTASWAGPTSPPARCAAPTPESIRISVNAWPSRGYTTSTRPSSR